MLVLCDSAAALVFMESAYDKIYEIMDNHTDAFLILGGDFNECIDPKIDPLNRYSSSGFLGH